MGVLGFYNWLKRKGYEPSTVALCAHNSFLVDAKLIMYKKAAGIPQTCENVPQAICDSILHMFREFPNVTFVNDGNKTIPHLKAFTLEKRKEAENKRKRNYDELKSEIAIERAERLDCISKDDTETKQTLITDHDVCCMREEEILEKKGRMSNVSTALSMEVLKLLGEKYKTIQCDGEADVMLMKLASQFDYVVSEDSDLLVGGGIRNLLRFMGSKNLLYSMPDILLKVEQSNRQFPQKYKYPKITLRKMQEMACLSGCDYSKGLNGMGLATAELYMCTHGSISKMFSDKAFQKKFCVSEECANEVHEAIAFMVAEEQTSDAAVEIT